jgi:hypothetical protein
MVQASAAVAVENPNCYCDPSERLLRNPSTQTNLSLLLGFLFGFLEKGACRAAAPIVQTSISQHDTVGSVT